MAKSTASPTVAGPSYVVVRLLVLAVAAVLSIGYLVVQNDGARALVGGWWRGARSEVVEPSCQYVVVIESADGARVDVHNFTLTSSPTYLATSSYSPSTHNTLADEPLAAVAALRPLIEHALRVVPAAQHPCTPVFLRVGTGLREAQRQTILDALATYLRDQTPFHIPPHAVDAMDSSEEAVYTWLDAKQFLSAGPEVALLSLSVARTEIVSPDTPASDYTEELRLGGNDAPPMSPYRRAFDGYGLLPVRDALHARVVDALSHIPGAMPKTDDGIPRLRNPCVPRGTISRVTLRSGPKPQRYLMLGGEIGSYDACSTVVDAVVAEGFHDAQIPRILDSTRVLLTGYFVSRLEPLLLSGYAHDLPTVTVDSIAELARTVCEGPKSWAKQWSPTVVRKLEDYSGWCLDLTRLLVIGYRLDRGPEVVLADKIAGRQIGWTVGAAWKLALAGAARCHA
ncbi:hypothetical protein MKEN_00553200 [Mycena kentingensis (nom. inval.)]|nr:hypothetical protein MKEN_00553200 [Mycena kentingensis (nom. inval.)]